MRSPLHPSRARVAFATVCLLLSAAGCGKKGQPMPPLRSLPEPVASLRARQVGDRIVLSMATPASRTDGAALGPEAALEILMVARDPVPRKPADLEKDPAAVWAIPANQFSLYAEGARLDVGFSLETIASELGLSGGAAAMKGRKLSFIGHVVGPENRRSAPTDIVTIPVCEPPAAPAGGWARITEEGILLGWSPVQAAGYHVYRKEPRGPRPESPLGPALTPAATTTFLDAAPAPGVEYRYLVRAFGAAPRCESADGAMVGAAWADFFPPAPPEALAAVEEEGSIRLFWRPGRDRDLRGYRVYRAEGIDGPFRLISSDPLTSTSYTDTQVAAGGVYGYAVTSLDGATPPNESSFSDPVMERMEPPR